MLLGNVSDKLLIESCNVHFISVSSDIWFIAVPVPMLKVVILTLHLHLKQFGLSSVPDFSNTG